MLGRALKKHAASDFRDPIPRVFLVLSPSPYPATRIQRAASAACAAAALRADSWPWRRTYWHARSHVCGVLVKRSPLTSTPEEILCVYTWIAAYHLSRVCLTSYIYMYIYIPLANISQSAHILSLSLSLSFLAGSRLSESGSRRVDLEVDIQMLNQDTQI